MVQRSHQAAPTQFVDAAGIRFAYRRFGKSGGVIHLALERIPRTTRAQTMDVLSSQASIAGYASVLEGSSELRLDASDPIIGAVLAGQNTANTSVAAA
jgi:NAD/NADP transhydrogenase alpha subunit